MSRRLSDQPSVVLALATVAWCLIVAVIDFSAGDEIPLAILYLPVVALACWRLSLRSAFAVAAVCSFFWLLDDWFVPDPRERTAGHYWLAGVHFVFFVVVSSVLSRLKLAYEHERWLARTDSLTGLANRAAFMEAADRALDAARGSRRPISAIYMDCDNFKAVNDDLGHQAGDAFLRQSAGILLRMARPADLPARLGGDEFAMLLPDTGAPETNRLAARMRAVLDAAALACHTAASFSVGAATFVEAPVSVDELLRVADERMYAVKRERKAESADDLTLVGENRQADATDELAVTGV